MLARISGTKTLREGAFLGSRRVQYRSLFLNGLAQLARGPIESLLPLYRDTGFAYSIASAMMTVAAVLIVIAVLVHLLRIAALTLRRSQITSFITFEDRSKGGVDGSEMQFNARFRDIDAAMSRPGFIGGRLAAAWLRYRRTLLLDSAPPVRSTQRPNDFFYRALPPPSWLGFAANLFVGFGLLATFIGLVAALTFATQGMQAGSTDAMQSALRDLLGAASSKFVTSIAGVGISIVLRLVERLLTANLRGALDSLSGAIELGVRVDSGAHSAALVDKVGRLVDLIDPSRAGAPPREAAE